MAGQTLGPKDFLSEIQAIITHPTFTDFFIGKSLGENVLPIPFPLNRNPATPRSLPPSSRSTYCLALLCRDDVRLLHRVFLFGYGEPTSCD